VPIKAPEKLVKRRPIVELFLSFFVGLNRDHLTQLLISVFIIGAGVAIFFSGALNRFETVLLDFLFRIRPPIPASRQIIYVEIAEDSLQVIKERPWPRHYHGVMLEILKKWGAEAVLFDYIFEGESNPFDDGVMEESLKKNKGVYLPVFVESVGSQEVLLRSIPRFDSHATGIGHINVNPDDDGILRRFKPFIEVDGVTYPHISLKLAYDLMDRPLKKLSDIPYKTDENGFLLISWPGKWTTAFQHVSYVDVLKSYESMAAGKIPLISPGVFKGRICMLGHTAAGGTDIKATPLDKSYPGLGVLASVVNGALLNEFITPATAKQNALAMAVLGLAALIFFLPFRNLISLLGVTTLLTGWLGFTYFMFVVHSTWFHVFQPAQLVLILFLFSAFYSKIASDRERLRFYKLSTTDGLTGVAVRRYFDVMSEKAFKTAKNFKMPLSIVLIDIDHFKKVNDTYGHQAGDEVLRRVSELIRNGIRFHVGQTDGDLVARYGGEEFVLLLPNTDLKTASFNVADRIRKAVEAIPIEYAETRISVTISLGVASLHDFDETAEVIVKRADDALYRSKENGRNRTSIETFN